MSASRSKSNVVPPLDNEEENEEQVDQVNVAPPAGEEDQDPTHSNDHDHADDCLPHETNDYSPMTLPDLWKTLDRELRTNIGNSVRCGICLSTVVDPVMTPCVHSFCRQCLHKCLLVRNNNTSSSNKNNSSKCPECNQSITKRGCQDNPYIKELADCYKQQLLEFAFLPSLVDPTFTTLTQALPSSSSPPTELLSLETCTDRLQVAQTWQGVLNTSRSTTTCTTSTSNKNEPKVEPIFTSENAKVVRANQKALQQAIANNHQGGGTQPSSTQERMEQCREQQAADQTWMEDGNDDDEQEEEEATQAFGTTPEAPSEPPSESKRTTRSQTTAQLFATSPIQETTYQQVPVPVPVKELALQEAPLDVDVDAAADDDKMMDITTKPSTTATKPPPFAAMESPILPETKETETTTALTTGTSIRTPFHFDYGDDDNDNDAIETETTSSEKQPRVSFQNDAAPMGDNSQTETETQVSLFQLQIPEEPANVSTRRKKPTPKAAASKSLQKLQQKLRQKQQHEPEKSNKPTIASTTRIMRTNNGNTTKAAIPLQEEHDDEETSTPAVLERTAVPQGRTTITSASRAVYTTSDDDKEDLPPPAATTRASRPPPLETNLHQDSEQEDMDSDDETVQLGPETQYQLAALHAEEQEDGSTSAPPLLEIGIIVNVQARTWPGVNKPGGVARITNAYQDSNTFYDVSYILGGKESQVDAVFVQVHEEVADSATPSGRRSRITPREAAAPEVAATAPMQLDPQVQAELPKELLAELAQQGFDTGVTVPKKKRKPAGAAALAPSAKRRSREGNIKKNQMEANEEATATTTTSAGKRKTGTSRGGKNRLQDSTNSKKSAGSSKQKKAEKPTVTETTTSRKKKNSVTPKAEAQSPEAKKTNEQKKRKSQPKNKSTLEVCLPKLSKEEMCEMADTHYEEGFRSALADQVIHVVASNLMDHDMDILRTLCCKTFPGDVKIKLSENFTKKTTLCIMLADHNGDNNNNLTPRLRTLKAMRAAINGVPIVSSEWIKACGQQNEVVVPTSSMFIRSLPTKTDELEKNGSALYGVASLAADYHRAPNAKKIAPLANCCVHLCGPFSSKKRSDIQLLSKEAGAKMLSSPSDAISKLKTLAADSSNDTIMVLLCDDPSSNAIPAAMEQEAKMVLQGDNNNKDSLLVVNSSWLFDTITCGSRVPPNAFEPSSPRAKELWQLTLPV